MTCATSGPIRVFSTRPFYRPINYFHRALGLNSGILPGMSLPVPLPDEPAALQALVLELRRKLDDQGQALKQRETEIARLQEQVRLLLAKRFGPSSEKLSADQLRLFNEAEAAAAATPIAEPTVAVPAHARRKRGRRPLPEGLPRIEILHDLPEAEKQCPCGCGPLKRIGEETSEQLDIVPARLQVLRHIRPKYACPVCSEGVKTASLPAQPIPKSLASPGLLAHITVAKYVDALPLYRQESILRRIGVELPRATLAHWMVKAGELIGPLVEQMRADLLGGDILQMDETTVQVLKEPGRSATAQSYLWVQRGGSSKHPILLFTYDPSRSQAVAERLLGGFQGYLQTDGYEGYGSCGRRPGIVHVGCFAHARRKFDEALKAQGKHPVLGLAETALDHIRQLYHIERSLREAPSEVRYQGRQEQAVPLLGRLRAWLDRVLPQAPPKSLTGEALGYLHSQWPKLIRYLDDGRLEIDNNLTENAIRPFVIGRRNWLFSDTVGGAMASARLYSLIETAKANRHEPYRYLRHLFQELPQAQTPDDLRCLLPYHRDPAELTPIAP